MTNLDRFTGAYGRAWTTGVLSEHLYGFERAGGHTHRLASGTLVALIPEEDGWSYPVPVLCSELIEVWTEDETLTGRCGLPVDDEDGVFCAGHAEEAEGWLRMSDPERAAWEKDRDVA